MRKVLISCPPMLIERDHAEQLCTSANLQAHCADVVQTLSEAELQTLLPEFDGWIAGDDPATRGVLSAGAAGKLRAVVKWGVGVDNIDRDACQALGLGFANTPGMFADEVADIAIAYLINITRQIHVVHQAVRSGKWPKPQGTSLHGKRAALVGYGSIGRAIGRRLNACEVEFVVYDPYVDEAADAAAVEQWPQGLEQCDFIILCCALTPENHHLINADLLHHARQGVRIVNVSRGPLIDEQALTDALDTGHVSAAALDVFESEPLPVSSRLHDHPQCLFGTHNASNTLEAVRETNERAVNNLVQLLDG